MKLLVLLLALSCAIAYASPALPGDLPAQSTGPVPHTPHQANHQNSIMFQRTLDDPNRQPSWGLNFNRNIANNDRTRADVFGGVNKVPGQRAQPYVGIEAERNFGKNGFIRGSGQLQPGRGGHGVSPSFGINGGFRFRREADPQRNSINFQGTQPLSGPNRQPSWDLNFNRNIANNDRTRADIFGGVSKVPGQRAQPHVGIEAERNFGNNGFIRGTGQIQPGPRGHGVSPTVGITGGFRFRREADPQNSVSVIGQLPLDPNRQPSWDLNFNRNLVNDPHTTADVFGGIGKQPGQHVQPHIGIQAERNFGNDEYLRGYGHIQRGPGGQGVSPTIGINGRFRFRREADPQNSMSVIGQLPLDPNRQPSWDLNFNRNLVNDPHTTADVFGGIGKQPGQHVQPHIGIQAERNFGNDEYLRGYGHIQRGPGGQGISPTIGINGRFRFRREAEDAEDDAE